MKHGENCDCPICEMGKKIGMIKKADDKKFTCSSCGSESEGSAGECCGKERE